MIRKTVQRLSDKIMRNSELVQCGNEVRPLGFSPQRSLAMPVWMEVLINVIGYAGFVGVATFNRSVDGAAQPQDDPCVS
jgi:hypothetical protein